MSLVDASTVVDEVNGSIKSELTALDTTVSELLSGSQAWAGVAASGFGGVMEQFRTNSNKLTTALGNISQLLRDTQVTYDTTEETESGQYTFLMNELAG